jgi:hypothetical protein
MTATAFGDLFAPAVTAVTSYVPLAIGAIVGVKAAILALPWALAVVRRLRP